MTDPQFDRGYRWEWHESACLTYAGFSKAYSPIGEYDDKFMVNQQVLRGASGVTSLQPQPHYLSQSFSAKFLLAIHCNPVSTIKKNESIFN